MKPHTIQDMVRETESRMRCNCDLDTWEPERSTGHSFACRIHKDVVRRLSLLPHDGPVIRRTDTRTGGVVMNNGTVSERVKLAVGHICQARDIMSSGPLDFYLEKLAYHSESLLTRFSPIKSGERATIVRKIKCSCGWKGSEKTLAIGRQGRVVSVDFVGGQFVYDFVPDEQWYQDRNGEYRKKDRSHSYSLGEKDLELTPEPDET